MKMKRPGEPTSGSRADFRSVAPASLPASYEDKSCQRRHYRTDLKSQFISGFDLSSARD